MKKFGAFLAIGAVGAVLGLAYIGIRTFQKVTEKRKNLAFRVKKQIAL